MTYGAFDIFYAPVAWFVGRSESIGLSDVLCIAFLGALCGYASMFVYRYCSPQSKLSTLSAQISSVRASLVHYDGEWDGMFALIAKSLRLSLQHLGLSFVTATLASVVSVLIALPLSTIYDFAPPKPGENITIVVTPAAQRHQVNLSPSNAAAATESGFLLRWPSPANPVSLQVNGVEVLVLPSAPMSGVLEPRHAFNALIGNPNGYLPANSSVTRIEFALPPRDILPFGPAWIRPWWFVFFLVVVLTSFWLRWRWKLH